MADISDSNYKLFSASQVALDLSISFETLIDLASTENCSFFIDIPENTDVYFRGYEVFGKKNFLSRQASKGLEQGPLIRIHQEIEFLCLNPLECSQLLHREQIQAKTFQAVGLMNEYGSVELIDAHSYRKRYQGQMQGAVYLSGSFHTYHPHKTSSDGLNRQRQPKNEKSIAVRTDNLLVSAEDLGKITRKLRASGPEYGKFKSQAWVSSMLMDLNEASTLFSSTKKSADKAEIESWFQKKWGGKGVGKDVIEQAANAILPDHLYSRSPSREQTPPEAVREYNDYASSALILINEAAKRYWKETKSATPSKRYPKRETIIQELQEVGLTRKLAGAASAIIRPEEHK